MEFSVDGSDNWETDAFQDKFIKEYFNNKSAKSSLNMTKNKLKKTKKRKHCEPNANEGSKCTKKLKLERSMHNSNAKNSTHEKTESNISERLMNLSQSKKQLTSSQQKSMSFKKLNVKNQKKNDTALNELRTGNKNKSAKKGTSEKFSASCSSSSKKEHNKNSKTSVLNRTAKCVNSSPREDKTNNFVNKKWSMKNNVPKSTSSKITFAENTETSVSAQAEQPKKFLLGSVEAAFPRNYGNNKRGHKKTSDARNFSRMTKPVIDKSAEIKEKARSNLQAAKFRLLNEKLYNVSGEEAYQFFKDNCEAFDDYHLGYQQQVKKWPVNPVDIIINNLRQLPKSNVIADLGCGDAKIARTLQKNKVYSFDLVAVNECVTCCDMAKVPLPNESVDIAVFCLSLMGTNLNDYLLQAFRILKFNGLLKIAEVESRIDDLDSFVKAIEAYGFSLVSKDISHKMFVLLDFNKVKRKKNKKPMSPLQLQPCLYKKR